MSSLFTKIIEGKIPCYKIAEDDYFFAFLDINPVAKGHVLVVPKQEVDVFFDLEETTLAGILPFCKKISKAIQVVVPCNRIGLSVVGLEVPHAHIHLIPISTVADMSFSKKKQEMSNEEFEDLALKIREQII
jgi:histidine triad (HIT) family protein